MVVAEALKASIRLHIIPHPRGPDRLRLSASENLEFVGIGRAAVAG